MLPFVDLQVHHLLVLVFYSVMGSLLLSLAGIITAVWAEKFDQLAAVTNFLITPLAFLSGTFYSIDRLPEPFYSASQFNPFFYLIDGFRYGFIGRSDGSLVIGAIVVIGINLLLGLIAHRILQRGWRLKA
jgi:ABC-2 type transport system permease protein